MPDEHIAAALRDFAATLPEGPTLVEYDNDVGPHDEYFVQWWTVRGVRFDKQEQAHAFAALLLAAAVEQEARRDD